MAQSQFIILKKDKSIDYHKEADEFMNILNKAKNEHDVQKYIKDNKKCEYSGAVKPPVRKNGNRLSGQVETANASLLA